MRYGGNVHDLLDAAFGQHGKTGLAGRHDVLMVAENVQGVGGNSARTDVEHAREKLAGDFVHVGDHQEQALRRGVGGGQRAGLQRSVHGACSAGFRLHFNNFNRLAENVFAALCHPLIHVLRHCGGRSDRVDGRHLGKRI